MNAKIACILAAAVIFSYASNAPMLHMLPHSPPVSLDFLPVYDMHQLSKAPVTKHTCCCTLLSVLLLFIAACKLQFIAIRTDVPGIPIHHKARSKHPAYPQRKEVDDTKVRWNAEFNDYSPVEFTHPVVRDNDRTVKADGWADPPTLETIDFSKRESYAYGVKGIVLDNHGVPRNPVGRTGMSGRGLLGKWGPNHAADPIVTRIVEVDGEKVIQMVAILRKDTGAWAIPGGMVDEGETVSVTLKREFGEETGNFSGKAKDRFVELKEKLFAPDKAKLVYQGYVDDPRNTDNAWMETTAVHYHCTEELGDMLQFNAGDDAAEVKWMTINDDNLNKLYASHKSMVLLASAELTYTIWKEQN